MTEPDILLRELFAADEPPARDPVFVAATMAKVARRRFHLQVLALVPTAVALGAVCWSVAPMLSGAFARIDLSIVGPAAAALSVALLVGMEQQRAY